MSAVVVSAVRRALPRGMERARRALRIEEALLMISNFLEHHDPACRNARNITLRCIASLKTAVEIGKLGRWAQMTQEQKEIVACSMICLETDKPSEEQRTVYMGPQSWASLKAKTVTQYPVFHRFGYAALIG